MLLTKPPQKILNYPIETDFNKWLKFAVMWDSGLSAYEKCTLSLLNILGEVPEDSQRYLEEIMAFYLCGKQPKGEPPKQRLLDWELDGDCVWADFRIYAGIDLCRAKLHWWAFMALFHSLPQDSGIKQRMSLRSVDLSKIKDTQSREEYQRAKQAVALEDTEESLDDFYARML